ncbi:MAG: hypothetical protein KY432_11080, partial [Acidobacteria bacterium]|nr:hypothetical protein [Acidobacteriota bacterium]
MSIDSVPPVVAGKLMQRVQSLRVQGQGREILPFRHEDLQLQQPLPSLALTQEPLLHQMRIRVDL